jgi:hypothetical protein
LIVTGPAALDGQVLLGRGEARWGREDPRWLPYFFLRRGGGDHELASTFAVVYEPFRDRPWLDPGSVRIDVAADQVVVEATTVEGSRRHRVVIEDGDAASCSAAVQLPLDNGGLRRIDLSGIGPTK